MDKVEHIAMTRGGLCQTSTCHREDNGQLYLDSLINISMVQDTDETVFQQYQAGGL